MLNSIQMSRPGKEPPTLTLRNKHLPPNQHLPSDIAPIPMHISLSNDIWIQTFPPHFIPFETPNQEFVYVSARKAHQTDICMTSSALCKPPQNILFVYQHPCKEIVVWTRALRLYNSKSEKKPTDLIRVPFSFVELLPLAGRPLLTNYHGRTAVQWRHHQTSS